MFIKLCTFHKRSCRKTVIMTRFTANYTRCCVALSLRRLYSVEECRFERTAAEFPPERLSAYGWEFKNYYDVLPRVPDNACAGGSEAAVEAIEHNHHRAAAEGNLLICVHGQIYLLAPIRGVHTVLRSKINDPLSLKYERRVDAIGINTRTSP